MTRDPLQTLLRLRQTELDSARTDLVARQEQAEQAIARAKAADAAIAREMAAASRLEAGDGAVEAFGLWLKQGRADSAAARLRAEHAEAEVVQARALLAGARAAVEVVEKLLEQRAAARQVAAAKRQQEMLDEVGQRRPPQQRG